MDHVSYSAIVMAMGLLIVIWVFLVRMIFGNAPDVHLRFLHDLREEGEDRAGSSPPRVSPTCLPGDPGTKTGMTRSAGNETNQHSAQFFRPDGPLLFTTSLRGRRL